MYKRVLALALAAVLLLAGCSVNHSGEDAGDIAATTAPVAQFARAITEGTGLTVTQVISDSVSCLHDYSLSVGQMEALETSRAVLISGAGLEDFMEDALAAAGTVIDCSAGIGLRLYDEGDDPHIWLDPDRAAQMAENIAEGLSALCPDYAAQFQVNAEALCRRLANLKAYGQGTLADLSCRELITFHDGFGYLADAFDLEILASIEEESGSEASAAELAEIVALVQNHALPAIFTEANGSTAAASVIAAETGVLTFTLDMAIGGSDYFDAMTRNIDTLKEALQ